MNDSIHIFYTSKLGTKIPILTIRQRH